MEEKKENKNELKVKKIRRILLLQIDKELKSGSNKKLNIIHIKFYYQKLQELILILSKW